MPTAGTTSCRPAGAAAAGTEPMTKKPVTPQDLAPISTMALIMQEFSPDRTSIFPKKCRLPTSYGGRLTFSGRIDWRRRWTPGENLLQVRGHQPAGSHKPTPPLPRLTMPRKRASSGSPRRLGQGSGQLDGNGCMMFGVELKVYMVAVSYRQKPYRRMMMETWGAKCVPSPSPDTNAARRPRRRSE